MKFQKTQPFFTLLFFLSSMSWAQQSSDGFRVEEMNDFEKVGKGICRSTDGILMNRGAYAAYGSKDWSNYEFSFDARVPETEEQVQIWASFHEQGRNERYVVGLKGGLQNDIEIGRMGLMGDDAFLGIRNMDFEPQTAQWYTIRIQVVGSRIRVFLNDDLLPRIDVTDERGDLLTNGRIGLGGSWITTEFRNLRVRELPADFLQEVSAKEYSYYLTDEEKKAKRQNERANYQKVNITEVNPSRSEISLDGQWLFKPEHEMAEQVQAYSVKEADDDWHVLEVPNFWNPSRIWLHGETFMEQRYPKGVSDTYFQRETDRCENYTFDYEETKVGWYRQWVNLPPAINGKHLELSFDAVSKVAEVYVNGQKAGGHVGMFGAFKVDVTALVKPGDNLIAVKVMKDYGEDIEDAEGIATIAVTVEVTNQMLKDLPHGFYRDNPAGIWQPVKLVITDPVKIEDVFIKPSLDGAEIEVTITNHGTGKAQIDVQLNIQEKTNGLPLMATKSFGKLKLNPGESRVVTYQLSEMNPKLWSPAKPNLYDFNFQLTSGQQTLDTYRVTSGFRTFETRGDYFYLNGQKYWLRAANHTPHALGINDQALAERTFDLYHLGNIAVTRSHTIPYSKVWLDAADKMGVGVSFEGTWPWLMIGVGEGSIPNQQLLDVWREEWLDLIKKYRNHPSLFYWTINNEMNFTHHLEDEPLLETKMKIVSDVVKAMRETDSTRPICFDSGYTRKQVVSKPDSTFFVRFDDGDIDDGHNYSGWYHTSIFDNFKRTPFMDRKTPGRPLISQEWSTGYPNTETGHHTRSYLWQHQNTQTHVGNHAYPFGDPKYSLQNNAFLTSELAQAIRRTHSQLAGMHHFSSITWFRNVYDAQRVEPYPTYYRMQDALNPVLVSAELWGRHFYAGEPLPVRFCVVNDQLSGEELPGTELVWELTYTDNRTLSRGSYMLPAVAHYGREWLEPKITLPENFTGDRISGKLRLQLQQNGQLIAKNEYDLTWARKDWVKTKATDAKIVSLDLTKAINPVLELIGLPAVTSTDLQAALRTRADLYILTGLRDQDLSKEDLALIRQKISSGARILMLQTGKQALELFPEYLTGYLEKHEETAHMDIEESPLFDGIDFMELRYFNNNQSEKPVVYGGLFQVNEEAEVVCIVSGCEHHYARGDDRRKQMLTMKGFPVIAIKDGGSVMLSEMDLNKGLYDPIPARLLKNMIEEMLNR
ncbi:sugar-binding domain-containing protein [Marinoscillum sp.]|uniref:sugar-binding domain-containing protein n=1 Tax=Marinoscillum sp. TaxID=2024838 RepID=UPI003BAC5723